MRVIISVPAAAVCLAGLEGRLVLPAFGEYIRLHPPFNYIAVTAAMYGVAFLVLLHASGARQPPLSAMFRWQRSVVASSSLRVPRH